jgi:uncharacterized protein
MNKRTMYQLLIPISLIISILSGCSSVFYQPTRILYSDPKEFNLSFQEIRFNSLDQTKLVGWNFPSKTQKVSAPESFTVFFHGNAQNLTAHYHNLIWMPAKNHSFFIFDYRGYGISGYSKAIYGKGERVIRPNQQGVHKDAVAALNKAYELFKASGAKRFIVYGQSLGGAILMRALEDFKLKDKIDLIILDSSFLSYQKLAFDKLWTLGSWGIFKPFAPLSYLFVSDEFSSRKFLISNTTKTLIIHGTSDRVIPFKFGEEIFQKLKVERKYFWKIEGGRHIDVFTEKNKKYREKLDEFIKLI